MPRSHAIRMPKPSRTGSGVQPGITTYVTTTTCTTCKRERKIEQAPCSTCGGRGVLTVARPVAEKEIA